MNFKGAFRFIFCLVCLTPLFWIGRELKRELKYNQTQSDSHGLRRIIENEPPTSDVRTPTPPAVGPANKAQRPMPSQFSQVYTPVKESSAGAWHDPQTNNPLDRLEPIETLNEEWSEGTPARSGWYPRVRIVRTLFKSKMLRIEEDVEVKAQGGTITVVRARIQKAMDANHVLVSSTHAKILTAQKIHSEIVKNPDYIKVPVESPQLVSSIPKLIGRLQNFGVNKIEVDSIIAASMQANDPVIGNGIAWHLENLGLLPGHQAGSDIEASSAWDTHTDASSVLVAVIDSGIASSDPELAPSIYAFPGETLGDGIDNDQNGFVDDALGYDFHNDDSNPDDESGHGSFCAALIGATGNNGFGSSGVAWKASILNCKFLDRNSLGTLSDAIDAIDYARNAGARILNLSWSYNGDATLLTEALGRCDTAGILMVCASGNSGSFAPVPAPASIELPLLVAVAASTPSDLLAPFSTVDPMQVHLAAPGVNLPVAIHNNPWNSGTDAAYLSGTSFSAALVSGSLALGLSEFPSETPKRMIRRMLESVDPIRGGAGALSSGGRLNLAKMLGTPAFPVPHDLFAQRLVLTDTSGQWTGRNDGATTESFDFSLGLSPIPQRTTWFEWTASSDGLVRVSARASDGAVVRLAAFTNSGGLPADILAQSNLGEVIEIPVVAGQNVFWMIDSTSPINEGLILTWQLPPTNDNWLTAKVVTGLPLRLDGNTLGATVESFELSEPYYPWLPNGSVWWKWTPTETGTIFLSPTAGHLAFLQPLDGGKPSFPIPIGNQNQYSVELGQSYAVLVVPISTAAAGEFSVSITALGDIAIMRQPTSILALAGETVELEVLVAAASIPSFQWFRNGEAIPFANSSTLKFSPILSQSFGTYHVVVSGNNTALQSQPAVVSPRYEQPRLVAQTLARSVVTGQSFDLSASFRSSSEMTYQWRKNGVVISGVSSAILIINNATATDAGTYSLAATNLAGASIATFHVNVFNTPWQGWVNRTPNTAGRGAIINVVMAGSIADAFTATEWMRSADGGLTWTTSQLPTNLIAKYCATDSNGTAMVSGGSFMDYGYPENEVWRKGPFSAWQKIQPVVDQPTGTNTPVSELEKLTFFDGKWWAMIYSNYRYIVAYSANGSNWTAIVDPSDSSQPMRAMEMFRFEDRLAIAYSNSSSARTIQLRIPGGGTKILNFLGQDVRGLSRIGDACYYPRFSQLLKIQDSQTAPTTIAVNAPYPTTSFFEGIQDGELFSGLDITLDTTGVGTGKLLQGIHEKTLGSRNVGFSCFTKSSNRWLVGYPDGRLWSGADLNEMPVWRPDSFDALSLNKLKAYENEFLFQKYHSSDGSRWQVLGGANLNPIRPLGSAGGTFLHSIRENGYNQSPRSFISSSMFPSALGPSSSSDFQNYVWSGENSLLNTGESGTTKFVKVIRNQPAGLLINNVSLGVNWIGISSAKQINGRWFVTTDDSFSTPRFIKTSSDGNIWTDSPLSVRCMIGNKNNNILAIESSSRGYLSTNGTGWTPFSPQGLPAGVPTAIVAYRGYFVAQYGQSLYASPDGVAWAASSAPLPITYLQENRHTMLAVTNSGIILQPGGETDSGPSLILSESLHSVGISRNQVFKYEVFAEDADGDLVQVECFQNGISIGSLSSAPFVFSVNSDVTGAHAIEFVAKDQAGRISRVTSYLTVLNGGVSQATTVTIDFDLSKAVFFKNDYYRIYRDQSMQQSAVCVWVDGNQWRPVSPPDYVPVSIVANDRALVVSTLNGIITSADGLNWTRQGGIFGGSSSVHVLGVKDGMIYLDSQGSSWVSSDGYAWSQTDVSVPNLTPGSQNLAWADSDFGISNLGYSGNRVTTDGGKNWLLIDSITPTGKVVAVTDGFIVSNYLGFFRISRGETKFTQIFPESDYWNLYAEKLDNLVFIGKIGAFLKSTSDGSLFTDHTHPPNLNRLVLRRFSGEWLSISSDMICATKDLKTWRTIIDFRTSTNDVGYLNSFNNLTLSQYGNDGALLVENDYLLPDFILHPDFSMSNKPAIVANHSIPDGNRGGLQFKNRTIAISNNWYFSRSNEDEKWESVALYPSDGFVPSHPHVWPTRDVSRYGPTGLFAATDQRFILLKQDSFNQDFNYVVASDDGSRFTLYHWTGPIPLPEVTRLASSATLFLASATKGRVLRSTNGLQWTVHQVSPSFEATSILFFAGKWHVGGKNGLDDEIWTSTDGISWSRSLLIVSNSSYVEQIPRPAFTAQGIARIRLGSIGWFRSSGGNTWQVDSALNQSAAANSFTAQGEHPFGVIGGCDRMIIIVDAATGAVTRRVDTGAARLRWLNGVPYLYSLGRFEEWTENDPRLTSISVTSGVYGVGDYLEIRLSALELPAASTRLQLLLSIDEKLGNDDDIILATSKWNDGLTSPDGTQRFTVPLPPSLTPGQFKVAARLDLSPRSRDLSLENNQILTQSNLIDVPGFQLRLTTNGLGNVNTSDPRLLYPQGTRLRLEAVPQSGYTFRGWEGSFVSSESAISVLMDGNKQLSLTFTQGNRIVVKTLGHGTISGAPALSVLLHGESIRLSQQPAQGWKFDGWKVNGLPQAGPVLSLQPIDSSIVEGVFVPDFESWRTRAFLDAPVGTNQSWDADPDGDGLTNWQEVLLSSNPWERQTTGQLLDFKRDQIRLVFTRPQGLATSPWIRPESTENLMQWKSADSVTMAERILGVENGIETVEVTLPVLPGAQRFFRLRMKDRAPGP